MTPNNRFNVTVTVGQQSEVTEASDQQLSMTVPIHFKRRSGRCLMTSPDGTIYEPRPWDTEMTPLQSALARGHRWLKMLESGEAKSMREIANQEGVDNSYVSRMINLTTLAPEIVEAILDDRMPAELTLFDLAVEPPRLWSDQYERMLTTND